jgi:small subunit ribosomal protein S6
MRPYEIAVIFTLDADDAAVTRVIDRVQSTIKSAGGKTNKVDKIGRKQFAYEINHTREGNYVYVNAAVPPEAVAETGRVLSLADEVVRHKIVRLPEGDKIRTSALITERGPERKHFRDRDNSDRPRRDKRDR